MKPIPAQRKSLRGDSQKKALTNPRFIAIIFMFSGLQLSWESKRYGFSYRVVSHAGATRFTFKKFIKMGL